MFLQRYTGCRESAACDIPIVYSEMKEEWRNAANARRSFETVCNAGNAVPCTGADGFSHMKMDSVAREILT